VNEKLVKKQITKYAIFSVYCEACPQKWYLLHLSISIEMKVTYSSFYSNWNIGKICNIEYFVAI